MAYSAGLFFCTKTGPKILNQTRRQSRQRRDNNPPLRERGAAVDSYVHSHKRFIQCSHAFILCAFAREHGGGWAVVSMAGQTTV